MSRPPLPEGRRRRRVPPPDFIADFEGVFTRCAVPGDSRRDARCGESAAIGFKHELIKLCTRRTNATPRSLTAVLYSTRVPGTGYSTVPGYSIFIYSQVYTVLYINIYMIYTFGN